MLCVGSGTGRDWRPRTGRTVRMAWEVLGQAVSALSHVISWDMPPKPPSRLQTPSISQPGWASPQLAKLQEPWKLRLHRRHSSDVHQVE